MRGAGGVWSPRDPVKVENTGSNPVRRAKSFRSVAQRIGHAFPKRETAVRLCPLLPSSRVWPNGLGTSLRSWTIQVRFLLRAPIVAVV